MFYILLEYLCRENMEWDQNITEVVPGHKEHG